MPSSLLLNIELHELRYRYLSVVSLQGIPVVSNTAMREVNVGFVGIDIQISQAFVGIYPNVSEAGIDLKYSF